MQKIIKFSGVCATVAALTVLAGCEGSGDSIVAPTDDSATSETFAKRDVIGDAGAICAGFIDDASLQAACDLVAYTNGGQDLTSRNCNNVFDGTDNGIVTYSLRNCDKNEEALLRKSSSAVLSLDDFIARGKDKQVETAANYLCEYADKFMLLELAGKLTSTMPLGDDAQDLADTLGFACG